MKRLHEVGRSHVKHKHWLACTGLGLWIGTTAFLIAAADTLPPSPPSPTTKPPAIDDQLLEDLKGAAPELESIPKTESQGARPPAGEDLGDHQHPLARVLVQMREAGQRLAQRDSSAQTQQIQQDVADELARLIEQLRSQQQSSPSTSSATQSSAESSESESEAQGTPPDGQGEQTPKRDGIDEAPENVAAGKNIWGHLPQRVREQIQSSAIEEFLPKYQDLIEAYYRRLAEEPSVSPRPSP